MGRSQWKQLLGRAARALADEMTALQERAEREGLEATPSRLSSIEQALEKQALEIEEVREQALREAREAKQFAAHTRALFEWWVETDSTDY